LILPILGKAIVIAICAAVAAWVYSLLYAIAFSGGWEVSNFPYVTLVGSFLGSFTIGLPIALLTYWLSHAHLVRSPATLSMIVALAAIMMILASYVVAAWEGVMVLGYPASIAAITYGLLGWIWILLPMRSQRATDA